MALSFSGMAKKSSADDDLRTILAAHGVDAAEALGRMATLDDGTRIYLDAPPADTDPADAEAEPAEDAEPEAPPKLTLVPPAEDDDDDGPVAEAEPVEEAPPPAAHRPRPSARPARPARRSLDDLDDDEWDEAMAKILRDMDHSLNTGG